MTTLLGTQWLLEQRATGHPDHEADYATEMACECDKLRARFTLAEDNARQSREEIEALKGDIAAMAENQGEWMRRAMALEDKLATEREGYVAAVKMANEDASTVLRLTSERDALRAQLTELRAKAKRLAELVEPLLQ